jgi:hypothetical protein
MTLRAPQSGAESWISHRCRLRILHVPLAGEERIIRGSQRKAALVEVGPRDGLQNEPGTTGSMRGLVEGLFPKERLLSYIRDFIAFEARRLAQARSHSGQTGENERAIVPPDGCDKLCDGFVFANFGHADQRGDVELLQIFGERAKPPDRWTSTPAACG